MTATPPPASLVEALAGSAGRATLPLQEAPVPRHHETAFWYNR